MFLYLIDTLFEGYVNKAINVRWQLKLALVEDRNALPPKVDEEHPELKYHVLPGS